MTQDTAVFIDAGYLSKIAKHFGKGKHIKYHVNHIAMNLAREKNLWCEEIYFYTAPPYQSPNPTPEENERRRKYDIFIKKVNCQLPRTYVKEGRLIKDSSGKYRQKGVDTHLTMDLLRVAQSKEVGTIILLACDTDFVPILQDIRERYRVKIILAYYFDRKRKSNFSMSNHMFTVCDDKILLREDHFLPTKKED